MTDLERLARAVLMYHKSSPWSGTDRIIWTHLTGEEDATTRVLCDLARELLTKAHHDANP